MKSPRDLRRYASQTNRQLVLGGIGLAFLVGVGLIYAIYGPAAAISGFLCIGAGASPLLLIWLALWGMEKWVHWMEQEEGE